MIRSVLTIIFLLLSATAPLYADFDERLWEYYADISTQGKTVTDGLGGLYLQPYLLGDLKTSVPFADLRVMDDRKREVPWQIVVKRPFTRRDELPVTIANRSIDDEGNSWIEGKFNNGIEQFTSVDIEVTGQEFYRQVHILGSQDGTKWNTLRSDGVIFDRTRGDRLRHTRVTIPSASYRYIGVRIINAKEAPLELSGLKIIRQREQSGMEENLPGQLGSEAKGDNGQTIHTVTFSSRFPVNSLEIGTPDKNFQRYVTVQAKRGDTWQNVAEGTIFCYETPSIRESSLKIEIPDSAAGELRLLFSNHDSPPLNINAVAAVSYRRQLVFRTEPGRSYYLFWGNPLAKTPQYDLSGLLAKEPDNIPFFSITGKKRNTAFAGDAARLPFSERYGWLLYAVMGVMVAGLLILQFRVLKKTDDHSD